LKWAEHAFFQFEGHIFPEENSPREKYLLPVGYSFVIPVADTTVNELPQKCIMIYWAALTTAFSFLSTQ